MPTKPFVAMTRRLTRRKKPPIIVQPATAIPKFLAQEIVANRMRRINYQVFQMVVTTRIAMPNWRQMRGGWQVLIILHPLVVPSIVVNLFIFGPKLNGKKMKFGLKFMWFVSSGFWALRLQKVPKIHDVQSDVRQNILASGETQICQKNCVFWPPEFGRMFVPKMCLALFERCTLPSASCLGTVLTPRELLKYQHLLGIQRVKVKAGPGN